MNNEELLEVIRKSFKVYLEVGTSRSTKKLKILHGSIAKDIQDAFGTGYDIKSQGIGNDKEAKIAGRYYSKNVDITVIDKKIKKPIAGYAVKFVMRNYSQNSNNYFENMLGETANIRANSIPYYQIFIIFDKVPYFKKEGDFKRYDEISGHNIEKYIKLSNDDPVSNPNIPDKTLFLLVKLKEKSFDYFFANEDDYNSFYESVIYDVDLIQYSNSIGGSFGPSVIFNDYRGFIDSSVQSVLEKQKNAKNN